MFAGALYVTFVGVLSPFPEQLTNDLDVLLGSASEDMAVVDKRVRATLGDEAIVWEGDAQTFQYIYVSDSALAALVYPIERWLTEPTFWVDVVVHEHDRDDAVSYCALATAGKQHHVFDYRARTGDGRVVWFRDYVKVLLGPRGVPARLRGVMVDVTSSYAKAGAIALRSPSRAALAVTLSTSP